MLMGFERTLVVVRCCCCENASANISESYDCMEPLHLSMFLRTGVPVTVCPLRAHETSTQMLCPAFVIFASVSMRRSCTSLRHSKWPCG